MVEVHALMSELEDALHEQSLLTVRPKRSDLACLLMQCGPDLAGLDQNDCSLLPFQHIARGQMK